MDDVDGRVDEDIGAPHEDAGRRTEGGTHKTPKNIKTITQNFSGGGGDQDDLDHPEMSKNRCPTSLYSMARSKTIFPPFTSFLLGHILISFVLHTFLFPSSFLFPTSYSCFPPPLPPSINALAHFPSSLSSSISLTCPSSKSPNSTLPYLTR